MEKKLKDAIEGSVGRTLKQANIEKQNFMMACSEVQELSKKINGFLKKFDEIKDTMGQNTKRFEEYQSEIEIKKLEISKLETQVENQQLLEAKAAKMEL